MFRSTGKLLYQYRALRCAGFIGKYEYATDIKTIIQEMLEQRVVQDPYLRSLFFNEFIPPDIKNKKQRKTEINRGIKPVSDIVYNSTPLPPPIISLIVRGYMFTKTI